MNWSIFANKIHIFRIITFTLPKLDIKLPIFAHVFLEIFKHIPSQGNVDFFEIKVFKVNLKPIISKLET